MGEDLRQKLSAVLKNSYHFNLFKSYNSIVFENNKHYTI